jgi:Protein of unknown function (DUF3618)
VSFGPIEDLERQIEETRRALDSTLHALQLELSPRHQLERAWHFAKDRTQRGLRNGARWATASPVTVALAAAAVAGTLYAAVMVVRRQRGR